MKGDGEWEILGIGFEGFSELWKVFSEKNCGGFGARFVRVFVGRCERW